MATLTVGGARVVTCDGCGEPNHPGSTRCGDCGGPLTVQPEWTVTEALGLDPRCRGVAGCPSDGCGVCTECVLHLINEGYAP